MAPEMTLLSPRHGSAPAVPRLDWLTLADAFEVACLVRCSPVPPGESRQGRGTTPDRSRMIEFNQELAAERMQQLLSRFGIPVAHEVTTGGLRRRYQLHRLHVPEPDRMTFTAMVEAGWWQGRREILSRLSGGTSIPGRIWRPRLAAAAWRSALLAAGRHVRKHILGVRLTDQDLAAVLVRGATLLDVSASLVPGAGCLVVSVPNGPDKDRILHCSSLPSLIALAS